MSDIKITLTEALTLQEMLKFAEPDVDDTGNYYCKGCTQAGVSELEQEKCLISTAAKVLNLIAANQRNPDDTLH